MPAEIEGSSVLDVIAPEDRAAWRANHERVCRGEALAWEFDVVGLLGTRRSMETRAAPLLLPDGRCAHLAVTRDVTARRHAEKRQALLVREVDHRAKNALAVALSLVRLTRAEDPRHFAEAVEGRIAALAHAHTLLAEEGWTGADLRAVAEAELAPYLAAGRVVLRGPPVSLAPGAVQPVSMVLHELATNAAKHGAFSLPGGQVEVVWMADPGTRDRETAGLELRWTESGGPHVPEAPRRRGFGSKLIEGTARHQLGGAVRQRWAPDGLCCEVTVAADRLLPHAAGVAWGQDAAGAAVVPAAQGLAGNRVLLVEDELLVAMELEEALRDLGWEVVGPAATVEAALRLAAAGRSRIDAAVLDVNLGGRPSFPVADLLAAGGVPVVFATGYGDLPDGRAGGGGSSVLLRKPLGRGELGAALSRVLATARAGGGEADSAAPAEGRRFHPNLREKLRPSGRSS